MACSRIRPGWRLWASTPPSGPGRRTPRNATRSSRSGGCCDPAVQSRGGVGMTAVRRAAAIATDLTCQAVGRRTVVRAARYVLSRARLDHPNGLTVNGESALQRWILRFSAPGQQIQVADVGANVGRWSQLMLAAAAHAG